MTTIKESNNQSYTSGSVLNIPENELKGLGNTLLSIAEKYPANGIWIIQNDGNRVFVSYSDVLDKAKRVLTFLRHSGLEKGDYLIFQLADNKDFITCFWACTLGGFIPVPTSLPPDYTSDHAASSKLENAWKMLDQPVVITSETLLDDLIAFGKTRALEGFRTLALKQPEEFEPSQDINISQANDIALILLTSGSTGLPKGVQLSHRNVLARSYASIQYDLFTSEDVSLNWMPLDHVGGLVMYHIRDLVSGSNQLQVNTDYILEEPLRWIDLLDEFNVTITWAPNFAFGLINEKEEDINSRSWDLKALRFILNGGEAIVAKTARKFLSLFIPHGLPPSAMKPAWGMSETSSGVTSSHSFSIENTNDADLHVSVGKALPGIELRIVDELDNWIQMGEKGYLQVKGPTVHSGYFKNSELNNEVFKPDEWFHTGDVAVLQDGELTITGRDKDDIIINGVNFLCHDIESSVEEVDGVAVSFTAATAIRLPGEDTDKVAVFFSPDSAEVEVNSIARSIRSTVSKLQGLSIDYLIPLSKDEVPKTAIGKIQRKQLRSQFESGFFEDRLHTSHETRNSQSFLDHLYVSRWRESEIIQKTDTFSGSGLIVFTEHQFEDFVKPPWVSELPSCSTALLSNENSSHGEGVFSFDGTAAGFEVLLKQLDEYPRYIIMYLQKDHGDLQAGKITSAGLEDSTSALINCLLCILQGIKAEHTPLSLMMLSYGIRRVYDTDLIEPTYAPLLGLFRTISQEYEWINAKTIDLERDVEDPSEFITQELSVKSEELEYAWRGGKRFTPYIEKAESRESTSSLPFQKNGVYLLSGGLGGIAQTFGLYLLREYNAKLIIIGRTKIPAKEERKRAKVNDTNLAEKIECLEQYESLGDVIYKAIDLSDHTAVEAAVLEAEANWAGQVCGIFHLAGIYNESPLTEVSMNNISKVMRPKMMGALSLHAIALKRPECFTIHFSSLISYFGSFGTGAYAAANNFIDAFSEYQRGVCKLRSYNFLWGSWTNIGMSRGADAGEALRSRGYLSIQPEQGIETLLFALENDIAEIIVGVDENNRIIQSYLHPDKAQELQNAQNADRVSAFEAPVTEVEKKIAAIWENILNVQPIGLNDNFFELGGRSLLAASMFADIKKTLGKNLPIPALFKAPTVRQISQVFIEQAKSSKVSIKAFAPNGSKTPIFVLPGAGVDHDAINHLADYWPKDHPVISLQIKDLASPIPLGIPVELDKAIRLLNDEIDILARDKSVILVGIGFGNLVALSLANYIIKQGKHIEYLALKDLPPANYIQREGKTISLIIPKQVGFIKRILGKKESQEVNRKTNELAERYGTVKIETAEIPTVIDDRSDERARPWTHDLAKRVTGLQAPI